MLCEKCKNKKPTVFFTDTGGKNHSLCAPCASSLSKQSKEITDNDSPEILFCPDTTLSSEEVYTPYLPQDNKGDRVCRGCKKTYAEILSLGEYGCPLCAVEFGSQLSGKGKMPKKLRTEIERQENLTALKQKLSASLESEDYEAAAALRDQIRKLEAVK